MKTKADKYVCVIGGANMDICGTPKTSLAMHDSNPGKTSFSSGGVGRNISENLARLGVKVVLISVFGDDAYAKQIVAEADLLGIDVSHSLFLQGERTSSYLCINDEKGDMQVALSDMDILDKLTPDYLATKLDVINGAECVVADTNIPHCLKYIVQNSTKPVFVDTVSAKKTALICDVENFFCVKPNYLEATVYSGKTELGEIISAIHAKGVSWVVISLGSKGVICSDGNEVVTLPSYCEQIVNTTGAGDGFVAGLVFGFVNGKSFVECVKLGNATSSIAVESNDTCSKVLTKKLLLERLKKYE